MPRIAIIFLLSLNAMAAEPCQTRVMAVDPYVDYDDTLQHKEVVAHPFPIEDFSPDGSFESILVKGNEKPDTRLELEVKENGKAPRKQSWELEKWDLGSGYYVAKDLTPAEFLKFQPATFVLRLTLNGKILCEDAPKRIFSGY